MPDEHGIPHPIEKGGLNKGLREVPQTGVPSEEYRSNYDKVFGIKEPWYVRRDRGTSK